jgi:hypothetical protein
VDREVRAQAVTVLHQQVRTETQPGFLVGVVVALFAMEVDRRIPGVFVLGRRPLLLIRAVLAYKTLEAGPRLDERAVHAEMLVAGPAFLPRQRIDFVKNNWATSDERIRP